VQETVARVYLLYLIQKNVCSDVGVHVCVSVYMCVHVRSPLLENVSIQNNACTDVCVCVYVSVYMCVHV